MDARFVEQQAECRAARPAGMKRAEKRILDAEEGKPGPRRQRLAPPGKRRAAPDADPVARSGPEDPGERRAHAPTGQRQDHPVPAGEEPAGQDPEVPAGGRAQLFRLFSRVTAEEIVASGAATEFDTVVTRVKGAWVT